MRPSLSSSAPLAREMLPCSYAQQEPSTGSLASRGHGHSALTTGHCENLRLLGDHCASCLQPHGL